MNKPTIGTKSRSKVTKKNNHYVVFFNALIYTIVSFLIHYAFGKHEKMMHDLAYILPLVALILSSLYVYLSKKYNRRFSPIFQVFEVLPDIFCITLAAVVLQDMDITGFWLPFAYLLIFFSALFLFYKIKIMDESETKKDEIEKLQVQNEYKQSEINKLQDEKYKIQNKIDDLQRQKNNIQLEMDVLRGRK